MKRYVYAIALLCASTLAGEETLKISQDDALKAATSKVQPTYSPIAKQMKVTGMVEVEAVVGTDGSVEAAKPVSGNPLLTPSAVAAAQKWRFTPFTSGGQPAKATVKLSFFFRL